MEPAPITPDEVPAFARAVDGAFHRTEVRPDQLEWIGRALEPERTLVLRDRGAIVAATAVYSRELTVPGAVLPVAGVTQVGVSPTHRRRGMLTALMHRQLADIREQGREAIAALWASEGAIYGRFGYGPASLAAELRVTMRDARLRAPAAAGQVELRAPADARAAMAAVYEQVRPAVPGLLARGEVWWDSVVHDPERDREGAEPLRVALIEDVAYALYAVKLAFHDGRAASEVVVREVMAATHAGHAAIWDFLLGLDLTTRLTWELAAADEPLPLMLTEPRAAQVITGDGLWVRLVDLPRALAERAYGEPFEVVLEVEDAVCPWNAGRWALRWDGATATCAATSLPAGLALTAAELGAAYLGGTTLGELARAGRVRELRAGALAPAARAFRADRAPWCPEVF